MKTELSSLLDGELEGDRHQAVLSALHDNPELRTTWNEYHLIGDALRRASHLELDLTARVLTELQREPAILTPRSRRGQKEPMQGVVLRYAAAVAGVGAVAWLALSDPATLPMTAHPSPPVLAQVVVDRTSPPQRVREIKQGDEASRLQAYLVAHQTYSPGNRFDGGAGYIRTVAASR